MGFLRILRHLLRQKDPFFREEQLPANTFRSYDLPHGKVRWCITGDYAETAKNHCAAVCLTNLALCFTQMGILPSLPVDKIFTAVHQLIGNGPIFFLQKKAKRCFSNTNQFLIGKKLCSFSEVKDSLEQGRPCALLLANHLLDWHWVLVLGYREYSAEECYLRMADGWHPTADRYYRLLPGAEWLSAIQFTFTPNKDA